MKWFREWRLQVKENQRLKNALEAEIRVNRELGVRLWRALEEIEFLEKELEKRSHG